jgi:hypothetical protein
LYIIAAVLSMAGPAWAQAVATSRPSPAAVSLPATIPIFPLEDVMLFPGMSVPLHIFEPRYRAMVADALKGNRIIGMVLLRPGYEKDYERSPSIFPTGCAGVITDVDALPNGEYDIVLEAISKFRITREEVSKPYRVAAVTAVPETLADGDLPALHVQRTRLEALASSLRDRIPVPKIPDGASDDEVVNGLSQLTDMDALDREQLLERDGVLARAAALIDLLGKAAATPR